MEKDGGIDEIIAEIIEILHDTNAEEEPRAPPAIPQELREAGRKQEYEMLDAFNAKKDIHRSQVPRGTKLVRSMWVESMKGDVCRSRLVAMEFAAGLEKDGVFAATPSAAGLRIVVVISTVEDLALMITDFSSAFLHAPAEETMYVIPPKDYTQDPNVIWEVTQALYGFRKSPKWFQDWLTEILVKRLEFVQCRTDPQVYVGRKRRVILDIHVDDPLGAGTEKNLKATMDELKH